MWVASLSSGETVREHMTPKGEPTAWQRLLSFCKETGVKITGVQIVEDGLYLTPVNKKSCDGFFNAYELQRRILPGASGPVPSGDRLYQGVGSVVGDRVFIQWLWLNPPDSSETHVHQEVRDLDDDTRTHCFLFENSE